MPPATQIEKLTDQVAALQSSVAGWQPLVQPLNEAVKELRGVAGRVEQLIAVHENKLVFQEKFIEKLQDSMEKRRSEADSEIKEVYKKMDTVETELRTDIRQNHEKIISKLDEHNTSMTKRIGRLEKWIWTGIGAGAIIIWLGEHFLLPTLLHLVH